MEGEVIGLIKWAFGLCVTGFLFLAGWMFTISRNQKDRPTFKETKEMIADMVKPIREKVDDMHHALMGDMKEEGALSKIRRIEENCNRKTCEK